MSFCRYPQQGADLQTPWDIHCVSTVVSVHFSPPSIHFQPFISSPMRVFLSLLCGLVAKPGWLTGLNISRSMKVIPIHHVLFIKMVPMTTVGHATARGGVSCLGVTEAMAVSGLACQAS